MSEESFEQEREHNRTNDILVRARINTRVPSKWRFVDFETGDVWKIDDKGNFHRDKVVWNSDLRGLHLIWEHEEV